MKQSFRIFIFIILLAVVLFGCQVSAAGLGDPFERPVSLLRVEGLTVKTPKEISEMANILTREGEKTNRPQLEADLKSLFLLGIFADVWAKVVTLEEGLEVTIHLVENPIIKKIQFQGNAAFSEERFKKLLKTKVSEILNNRLLEEDITSINNLYHQEGYDLARCDSVLGTMAVGELTIRIVEGEIEAIKLEGNKNTQDYVVLREMETRPGDIFNSLKLREDRQRILRLGYFSNVGAPRLSPGKEADKVIVYLDLSEQKTNRVNFGAAIQANEWYGFTNLNINNFLGTGETVSLKSQLGQKRDNLKYSYNFRYFNPWFLNDPFAFSWERWFKVGRERFKNTGQDLDVGRNGWLISFGFPLGDYLRVSTDYKNESVGGAGETVTYAFPPYELHSLALGLTYNTLDNWENPSRGSYWQIGLEHGGKIGELVNLGGVIFQRYSLNLSQFFNLSANKILGIRLALGFYKPSGEETAVLEEEVYSIGGGSSVRGYPDKHPFAFGTRKLVANLEYRHFFNQIVQGVLFVDWGGAFDSGLINLDNFKLGKGFGFRISTPLAPIRFDWGWGETTNVVHFSLGQAF